HDPPQRRSDLAGELQRCRRGGRDGRLNERVTLPRYRGAWRNTTDAINGMIDDLVRPTTEIARVIDAVADGDLSQRMELRIDGRPCAGSSGASARPSTRWSISSRASPTRSRASPAKSAPRASSAARRR